MDKPDIEYLNIPQKIKKKLYKNSLNTVEKISTYYLEDLEFEEIELVQDEIFKYHINDLGINNKEENEKPKNLTKDKLIINDFYSYSDVENYCNNNDILGSSENNFSDSSEMSISSYSSSNSCHYKNSKDNLKKFNDTILKSCTQNWISKIEDVENEKKKHYSVQNKLESQLEKDFLIYSNFMKKQLKISRAINTSSISLNKLLNSGIENSQIYFFYGNNAKINKIILINLLYNFIYPPGNNNNNMSTHSVVYIYFSYIFDITVIKNILSEKLNHENKTQEQKYDFFNNFYIMRIQNFNEFISFLLQLKKNYFTKNKSKNNNGLNNISCIGIYNFINIIKNFNTSNQNSYFYLIHELKIISKLLGISILIFDYALNEISDTTSATNIGDTNKDETHEMNNTSTYDEDNDYKNVNADSDMYNKSNSHMSGKGKHYGITPRKYINNNQDCYSEKSSSFFSDNYSDNDELGYSEYESGNNFNIDPKIKDIEKGSIIKIPFSCSRHNKFDFIIEIKMVNKIRDKYIIRFTLVKSRTNIKHSYSYCSIQKCVLTDLG
ncbi:conserved Plasmodium protein, unknown function [Plasmodium vinckei vinckei]|uniref:Uncharacterized protein n=1 Tax=Plasmodium vinckei vinckei TaxID=54757 RepID=A0A081IBN8_PLAVN|nr:conserved Plasmodium protein, unknown function [Plasmodium vinckei vinckei]KEG01096.1 hypothetical protein YYE_04131 [Plasmodium vinckei vinckei]VEV54971.1 conserved Plasmodium protein, unknown function [Plasmodium vinckei vinckei]